ncbi:ABC transporter ATP-binding protein [Aureimonas flava]|uniref:ABC transporter ATP-binding protein n=1 Tax=Aureimonas flava TaxID=2320271 RepID=A0A3A1WV64_9HYPH|nr:ABC transporter ATP-binding protein [Aureimonas flava]RIY02571.1 ABC transporter ATP-binding protein [Aureimonas flava]
MLPPARDATSGTPVLECRDLCISYFTRAGEIPAVVDFNLRLMPGEAHGLVGESGCGKSTIALAVMQYLGRNGRITGGQILFEGRDMLSMSPEELRRIRGSRIAMVYQEPMASLNPAMTIRDQLAEVPIHHEGVSRAEARRRALEMLHRVKLPDCDRIMRAYPHQISGGQQQRVVIAMALLSQPKVLLLDEPTTALDVTVEAGIVELIGEIAAQYGTALLYVSHNLGLIRETCQTLTVMYSGEAVETGTVGQVFSRMHHPYTRGLFGSIPVPGADKNTRPLRAIPGHLPPPQSRPRGCNFNTRCAFALPGLCDRDPVAMRPVGGEAVRCLRVGEIDAPEAAAPAPRHEAAPIGDVVVDVRDLSKRYHELRANRNLTFDARQGETVAIVGESGCGKSTFARILAGLEEATSGELEVAGTPIGATPVQKRSVDMVRNLQMVFQNPFDTLNPSHTVGSQIARVIRKFGVETDEARIRARVLELLDLVKLPREYADRRPRQLSGGQKQRIGIARAFAGNPAVVVADEPVSALDVSVQAAVADLLMSIQREQGTTLIFISHDLAVVRYLADRIVVMYLGQIVEQGTADEVFAAPYHPYTEALLSAVPIADVRLRKRRVIVSGDLPSAKRPPPGCPFSTRCNYAIADLCANQPPPVQRFSGHHSIACHLPRDTLAAMEPVITMAEEPA